MRHFVGLFAAIATLARSVGVTPAKAGLVTFPGALHATGAHPGGAVGAAVTVTAIAAATQDYGCATAGAQVASRRSRLHWQIVPTGFGWTKPDAS